MFTKSVFAEEIGEPENETATAIAERKHKSRNARCRKVKRRRSIRSAFALANEHALPFHLTHVFVSWDARFHSCDARSRFMGRTFLFHVTHVFQSHHAIRFARNFPRAAEINAQTDVDFPTRQILGGGSSSVALPSLRFVAKTSQESTVRGLTKSQKGKKVTEIL